MSQRTFSTNPTEVVGANVRAEAARRRISQRAMGAALGLSNASVCQRLAGRTPIDINELVKFADLFGVPLGRLLEGVDDMAASA